MAQNKPPVGATSLKASSLPAIRPLLRRGSSFTPFQRTWSTDSLIAWLRERGLSANDCDRLRDEEFTGESFILLEKSDMKDLGIKIAGQMLLGRILEEIKKEEEATEPGATTPSDIASHSIRANNLSETVSNNFSGPTTQDASIQMPTPPRAPAAGSNVIRNQLSTDEILSNENSEVQNDELREEPTPATPSTSQVQPQESQDEARVEEVPTYCTSGPYEGSSVFSYDHSIFMYRSKVWAGRQVLRVYFMNPEVLSQWRLTVDKIIEWAMAWPCDDERIPIFKKSTVLKKADIRVKFSDIEGCWSVVGMDAEKMVGQEQPTMLLNLKDHSSQLQRSLVIHEFGHALGLDHEHQRSDFLDVVGDLFKIPQDQKARVKKIDEMVEREESCPYDPDSIMHYWFDLNWLKKPEHRDSGRVMGDNELTQRQKTYLIGVQRRQRSGLLPKDPSRSDITQLIAAYDSRELARSVSSTVPTSSSRLPHQTSSFEYENNVLQVNVHLKDILRVLWEERTLWRSIGTGLGLSQYDLDALERSNDKLESVLSSWMHKGNATIDQLISVLKSPLVNKPNLADEILRTINRGGLKFD